MPSLPPSTYDQFIPSGFDWADGSGIGATTDYKGTPTPARTVNGIAAGLNTVNSGYIFEEYSTSPEVELGEQGTIVHHYNCDYLTAQYLMVNIKRGDILLSSDNFLGNQPLMTRVLLIHWQPIEKATANVNGNMVKVGKLDLTAETLNINSPPDEFNIEVVELNPALEKHPRYAQMSYNDRSLVRSAVDTDNPDLVQQSLNSLYSITSQPELTQSVELLLKRNKGIDSFYLSAYRITWSQYFWLPPTVNPGGYIEDPFVAGGLPIWFWSTTGDSTGTNIFANTTYYNENMFPCPVVGSPYGLNWLRQTDQITLQRTWFKVTHSWLSGPIGNWDSELYSPIMQPYQTSWTQGGIVN